MRDLQGNAVALPRMVRPIRHQDSSEQIAAVAREVAEAVQQGRVNRYAPRVAAGHVCRAAMPEARPTRRQQAMSGGAGMVERNGEFVGALDHEMRQARVSVWAIHELRDMGYLERDLVETAERFSALHLKLEPRASSSMMSNESRASGGPQRQHAALLNRSALAEHVAELYCEVGNKIGATRLVVFATAFSPLRPCVSELKAQGGINFVDLVDLIQTGLTKLWAREPITPRHLA